MNQRNAVNPTLARQLGPFATIPATCQLEWRWQHTDPTFRIMQSSEMTHSGTASRDKPSVLSYWELNGMEEQSQREGERGEMWKGCARPL